MADMRHIDIFLSTINYALHIPGRYVTNLNISPTIKYALQIPGRRATEVIISPTIKNALIFLADMRQISLFIPAINYAMHIRGRYATYLLISSHNYVCPVYSWKIRDRFTNFSPQLRMPLYSWQLRFRFIYFSSQLSMPCIFLANMLQVYLFLPAIKYAPYITRRYW